MEFAAVHASDDTCIPSRVAFFQRGVHSTRILAAAPNLKELNMSALHRSVLTARVLLTRLLSHAVVRLSSILINDRWITMVAHFATSMTRFWQLQLKAKLEKPYMCTLR